MPGPMVVDGDDGLADVLRLWKNIALTHERRGGQCLREGIQVFPQRRPNRYAGEIDAISKRDAMRREEAAGQPSRKLDDVESLIVDDKITFDCANPGLIPIERTTSVFDYTANICLRFRTSIWPPWFIEWPPWFIESILDNERRELLQPRIVPQPDRRKQRTAILHNGFGGELRSIQPLLDHHTARGRLAARDLVGERGIDVFRDAHTATPAARINRLYDMSEHIPRPAPTSHFVQRNRERPRLEHGQRDMACQRLFLRQLVRAQPRRFNAQPGQTETRRDLRSDVRRVHRRAQQEIGRASCR